MFKYWIKRRLVFSFLITLAISVGCGLLFYGPYLEKSAENHFRTSTYEDTNIDYDIPSPTDEQIKDLLEQDFVEDCLGYYITEGDLDVGDHKTATTLILIESNSFSVSTFPSAREIESNHSYEAPVIFLGYDFAKKNSLSIGDTVKYGDYEMTVAVIAEPDAYRSSQLVYMGDNTALQSHIKSLADSYSGAFVDVNDKTKAESYFRSYKPLGRLRDASEFETEEQYRIHYAAWNDADYSNEITSFEDKLRDVRLVDTDQLIIGVIVYAIVMIVSSIVLFVRKAERSYFKQKKSKRGITGYYVATMIIEILIPGILFFIGGSVIRKNCEYYVTDALYNKALIIVGTSVVCVAIFDFVLNCCLKKSVSK